MTYTPIPKGTQNWDVPLNAALAELDASITTTSGNSLQAANNLSDLTNTVQAVTNLGLSTGVRAGVNQFNVKDYGALGNGVADDTTAVQNAINAAAAATNGGVVYFPPGNYIVTPVGSTPALTIGGNNVKLLGAGRKATTLTKSTTGTLLRISGPSTDITSATHRKYCSVESLGFSGNSQTGLILELFYADNLIFRDLFITSNLDTCIDTAEFWDSRFEDIVIESSGSATASTIAPNVYLRNSTASSGYGFSADNVNQISFFNCRFENFFTGAIRVEQGTNNTNNPNGIYIQNCKMESSQMNGGSHLYVADECTHVMVDHLYCYAGGFYSGFSTAQNIINWAPQNSVLENVIIANGAIATINSGVDLFSGASTNAVIRNVVGKYITNPTGSHIFLESSTTAGVIMENCKTNVGTQFGGTQPAFSGNVKSSFMAATSTDLSEKSALVGDTKHRFTRDITGKMNWGPGGSTDLDTNLYRSAADTLATDDAFNAIGGLVQVHTGFTAFGTGGSMNTLNVTSGANITMVAGTIYWAAVFIPFNISVTGIIASIGTTGGTDSWITALYSSTGTLIANSSLSGIAVGTANTKQKFVFTAPATVIGPGVYYIALQSNGTTAKFLAFPNATEGFVTGSVAGTFGTLPSITPGTAFTQNVGPFASTY